jgi:hypothetical protein
MPGVVPRSTDPSWSALVVHKTYNPSSPINNTYTATATEHARMGSQDPGDLQQRLLVEIIRFSSRGRRRDTS